MQTTYLNYLAALFATQMVLHIYGAGLRRPFGSMATVSFLPRWLRESHNLVFFVDCLFVVYILVMWVVLAGRLGFATAIWCGLVFSLIGDYLSLRLGLVASLFISGLLVILTLLTLPLLG